MRDSSISKNKFHRIWEKHLTVALEAIFTNGTMPEEVALRELSTQEKNLLIYQGYDALKLYTGALLEGNLFSDDDIRITSQPWFRTDVEGKEVQSYWLLFRSKSLGPNFPIFARFDETKTFGPNLDDVYQPHLIYFGVKENEETKQLETIPFKPLYVKLKERHEDVYLVIKSEVLGELQISIVQESEVPPHLATA